MKVVQINAVCEFGSTGRIVCELSDYLAAKNIENIIFYGNGTANRDNAFPVGTKIDHKIHAFLSRLTGLQGYFSCRATRRMLKQIKQFQPDIVHLHNLHGNYINLPLLFDFLAQNKIATVITLHDCFFFTGKCVHYSLANCNRWQSGCGSCAQLQSGNPSWFLDRTKTMLQDKKRWGENISQLGIIGVSRWVTGEAKKSVLSCASQIETIYNWIDVNTFAPHTSDIREKLNIKDKFVILGVSVSWTQDKGMEDFNRLAALLDDRFQIVLVGQKVGDLHEKILHIGRTTDVQMMSDLYAAADVFYNPTRRETFGKVTAEALACGTPVIAYDTTACPELVGEGCGYVEAIGDVEAVHRDILRIEASDRDYSGQCREFAVSNFTKETLLEKTIRFYQELLETNKKRG